MLVPSPKFQITEVGRAVAVTDWAGPDGVAETGVNTPVGSQANMFTPTNWGSPGRGFEAITGVVSFRSCCARCASTAGVGFSSAAGGGFVSHTQSCVVVATGLFGSPPSLIPSRHVLTYQAPLFPACL